MTLNDLQKAQLVLFAVREAGPHASLEQMKAICYCLRNRVRAGWHDGSWLLAMEEAGEYAGNLAADPVKLDPNSRPLQRLLRDIDDIYYGHGAAIAGDEGGGADLEAAIGECRFWCFLDRPMRPWFAEHVVRQPAEHPNRAQMGMMQFFE